MTVVPLSREPGNRPKVFGTATAATMGATSWYSPRSTAAARCTARAWVGSDSPFGSRWTTATRLISGYPNVLMESISACTAGLSDDTSSLRSLPVPSIPGRNATAALTATSQNATTSHRRRTIHRAYPPAIRPGVHWSGARVSPMAAAHPRWNTQVTLAGPVCGRTVSVPPPQVYVPWRSTGWRSTALPAWLVWLPVTLPILASFNNVWLIGSVSLRVSRRSSHLTSPAGCQVPVASWVPVAAVAPEPADSVVAGPAEPVADDVAPGTAVPDPPGNRSVPLAVPR